MTAGEHTDGAGRALLRRGAAVLAAAAIGMGVIAVGYAVGTRPRSSTSDNPPVRTVLEPIRRGTATERVQVSGVLGYAGSYRVVHTGGPGIMTSAAAAGSTVGRGGVLYAVANEPVRLLVGRLPAYRDFRLGMVAGPDVRQLEENLRTLGMDPQQQMTVDNRFTAATAAAVRRWQTSWGGPSAERTGTLLLGRVAFLPGALRVSQVTASVGASLTSDAEVLTGTSLGLVVSAQVAADRRSLLAVGDDVLITLPAREPVTGRVTSIGQPSVPSPGADGGTGNASSTTFPVTISVRLPSGGPDLNQTPVQVAITTASHSDVLLVPVTALLARPGGGYQVRLDSGVTVPVTPGLFDDDTGLVEVGGEGLREGQVVEVPAG